MLGDVLAHFSATLARWLGPDQPVDWRGISYVLGGVIVALSAVIVKLYKDGRAKDRALAQAHADHEEYLKELLDDLKP